MIDGVKGDAMEVVYLQLSNINRYTMQSIDLELGTAHVHITQ
jgi:hypothetical protein